MENSETPEQQTPDLLFYAGESPTHTNIMHQVEKLEELFGIVASRWKIVLQTNPYFLYDIVFAHTRDVNKILKLDGFDPNHYKIAGHIAFWIRKLKPIVSIEFQEGHVFDEYDQVRLKRACNELLAIYVALSIIRVGEQNIPESGLTMNEDEFFRVSFLANKRFVYDFRFRSMTPYTLSNYLYLMCHGGIYPPN